ncbi:MAG: DNA-3-methyladenine glycosylase 2 family protein, partial [Rhodobacteraceae bacterium]|nr:DNA-3-methyladenine glycosylase 2 family protein [Paracoccaceae bacterium]
MNERLILGDACVAEGAAWLAAQDPRFADALEITDPLPLRLREGGFHQLLSAIVS